MNMHPRHRLLRHVCVGLVAACASLAVGCSSQSQLETSPTTDAVHAAELMPLRAQTQSVTMSSSGVATCTQDRTEAIDPGVYRRSVPGYWVVDMVVLDDGAIAVVREVDLLEDRRVAYDPPLPILPGVLKPGEPYEAKAFVSVYRHTDNVQEAVGEVTATYQLIGKVAGTDDGGPGLYIVRTDRTYKLPLVVVDLAITSHYRPGVGPIYARIVRTAKLFGLIPAVRIQEVRVIED